MKIQTKLAIAILIVTGFTGFVVASKGGNPSDEDVKPRVEEVKLDAPALGIREIGGGRIEQAKAFLILANLSKTPGELLNFIKECRANDAYHHDCKDTLIELKRGLSLYQDAHEAGNIQRLARSLDLALKAPVGETIIQQPPKPLNNE